MGAGLSNPVDDATKQEMEDIMKSVLGTFTTQYTKAYVLSLVLKVKMDQKNESEDWKLLERPPKTDEYKTGYLVKEGAVRKNWKKRFFAVRPNYTVDYYASEEDYKKGEKGKKKGSMSLCGYHVVEDVNDGILLKLKKLAEMMGVDFSELPKPKEYPPLTFELHHDRRRCYFITAENEDEFKAWVSQFRDCCRHARGLKNDEFCHGNAFEEAIRKTRYELGRWGWWSGGGSEEQVLGDIIKDELDYRVMYKIYGKITGSWTIRNAVRNNVLKAVDTAVMAAITPAWAAMEKAVAELRPKIEPTITEMTGPIFKTEAELTDKIKEGAMSKIEPVLEEKVVPHLAKIVEVIKMPVVHGFDECKNIFVETLKEFKPQADANDTKRQFYFLDNLPWSYKMRPAKDKVDILYEPLWALNAIFEDIRPWSLIYKAQDLFKKKTDNAVYTFEQKLIQRLESGQSSDLKSVVEKVKEEVLEDWQHDVDIAVGLYYHDILKDIVYPPFEKVVIPLGAQILAPIGELIPDPMKQFLDPEQMFEDLVEGIVDDCISTCLKGGKKEED